MTVLSFENQMYILVGVLLLLLILCLILLIVLCVRFERLKKRQMFLYDSMQEKPLDAVLATCLKNQTELFAKTEENQEKLAQLLEERRKTFDKIAVVRYSSGLEDTDEADFSVGITNREGEGIVVTGLQQTAGTKLSVKSVNGEKSSEELTDEELYVIQRKKAK